MSLSPEALEELLAQPALQPPAGVTANFDNPSNNNGLAWAVTTVCTVVATICLLLRLFARLWLDRTIRLEESEWALRVESTKLTDLTVLMICAYVCPCPCIRLV